MLPGIIMEGVGARVGALVAVAAALWVAVWFTRRIVEARRQQALRAAPTPQDVTLLRAIGVVGVGDGVTSGAPHTDITPGPASPKLHILAFSSDDCRPCHTLQKPALERLLAQRPDTLTVAYIDAPTAPELTRRFQVLTVPTTVVLDDTGKPHAINYGFANLEKLLAQVDAALAS